MLPTNTSYKYDFFRQVSEQIEMYQFLEELNETRNRHHKNTKIT